MKLSTVAFVEKQSMQPLGKDPLHGHGMQPCPIPWLRCVDTSGGCKIVNMWMPLGIPCSGPVLQNIPSISVSETWLLLCDYMNECAELCIPAHSAS